MADIDIDFENPDIVKSYIKEKYGEQNFASVSTYGTFHLRGLLKDLNRVYNILSFQDFNKLNKDIFDNYKREGDERILHELTLENVEKKSNKFKNFLNEHKFLKDDLNILLKQVRHISRHASGVVICDNLFEKMPIQRVKNEMQTSMTEPGIYLYPGYEASGQELSMEESEDVSHYRSLCSDMSCMCKRKQLLKINIIFFRPLL